MKRKIRIGSRDSVLAVRQTRLVMDALARSRPELDVELVTMKTTGDLNQGPFEELNRSSANPKGLFTKELEQALLDGRVDMAVHSLKDMPVKALMPDSPLPLLAFFKRGDPRDALVCKARDGREAQEPGAVEPIGCSAARRRVQLEKLMPGRAVRPIRGNVLTRLKKLDEGAEYSSLVLAAAGLIRLDLERRISRVFEPGEILPAAGQGTLVLQGLSLFAGLAACVNDPDAEDCARCEMAFTGRLNGGCSLPVAAYAEAAGTEIRLTGLYADESCGIYRKGSLSGSRKDAARLGETLAGRLMRESGVWGSAPGS